MLATSGIETVVRLWSPPRDADESAAAAVGAPGQEDSSLGGLVARNQERMREGPQLLRGVNPRILQVLALLHFLLGSGPVHIRQPCRRRHRADSQQIKNGD